MSEEQMIKAINSVTKEISITIEQIQEILKIHGETINLLRDDIKNIMEKINEKHKQ